METEDRARLHFGFHEERVFEEGGAVPRLEELDVAKRTNLRRHTRSDTHTHTHNYTHTHALSLSLTHTHTHTLTHSHSHQILSRLEAQHISDPTEREGATVTTEPGDARPATATRNDSASAPEQASDSSTENDEESDSSNTKKEGRTTRKNTRRYSDGGKNHLDF